ncbi:MAG: phosphoadenylyl-sulfate reductase [Acidobacteria bacterium]|nr:MAG: phosphoadenylyl-sulfate reductase [Acidobacteriota bacterium]
MGSLEQQVTELQRDAEGWNAQQTLRWGISTFGQSVALACSFGAEDVVLIDMASRLSKLRVFTLDTDFLFPETYALMDEIEARYGLEVERTRAELTPEAQAAQYGPALWASRPDACCQLRKVEPLKKKLSGLAAWVTGVRRDQAPTRANTCKLEWDAKFGLAKLNPLADWNWLEVWEYIRANNVPYNPLHDRDYPSIGCTYCTRPVKPGEDPRAGRWSGFAKTECGLHVRD